MNHNLAIRSFATRQGRFTASQQRAVAEYLPRYALTLPLAQAFGRSARVCLEIGFGMGDTLVELARAHPEQDYIGVEVYPPGVGRLLTRLAQEDIPNVRVHHGDAVPLLRDALPPSCLDEVYIYFPDPWPKKRHNKRRLVQTEFIRLIARTLKPSGWLALATDWEPYAHHMLAVLEAAPEFTNAAGQGRFHPRPAERPLTKFEQRGARLGHGVWDLRYCRTHLPPLAAADDAAATP